MTNKQDVYSVARDARDRVKATKDDYEDAEYANESAVADYDEAVEAFEAANRDSIEAQAAYEDAESVYEEAIADYAAAREARARVQAAEDFLAVLDRAMDSHADCVAVNDAARARDELNNWRMKMNNEFNKALITIEILVPIIELTENDKGMTLREMADYATGGILIEIKDNLKNNNRDPEIISAKCEYRETFDIEY